MLTFDEVVNAPVGKLKEAADDWSDMVTKLEKLADDARQGMKAKSDKAQWQGANSDVTRPFIAKTAKEFDDAAAQAKGIKLLLDDAHTSFKTAKDALVRIRDEEGPAAGIHVDANGKVTPRHDVEKDEAARHDTDRALYQEAVRKQKEAVASWQKKIDQIVDDCSDADESLKRALAANVTDDHNFTAPKYKSLDQEEAAHAAALAAKGRDITHTELQALNELLHDNSKSPEFSKNFYEKLGPEKSLAFFGQLSMDTYEYGKLDKERLKDVQALQKNLGLTLATASHDKTFTAEWGPELRKLGTERIPLAKHDYNGPFGYQLLGGIMRYGNYDAKFLNPIAEHVAQLHAKDPYMFAENKMVNGPFKNPFNPSGVNGSGYDPTVAMLEALGHSPGAAKHFFTDPPTAYNEDGTVNKGATADLGKDKGGKPFASYLDFFTDKDWKSFGDVDSLDPKEIKGSLNDLPDALGHALEAAALGYAWDDPNPNPVRDEDTAKVMNQVVEKYAPDAGLLKRHEALSDSLGNMTAGYIDDINWALQEGRRESVFAPIGNEESHVDLGRDMARDLLSVLGQHPDAYATVSKANEIYTTSVLEAQVDENGKIDTGRARSAVGTGAEVQGMLDQSRADQVEATNLKTHEEYQKEVQKRAGWVQFGATTALAAGVAFLPVTAAVGAAAVLIPLATDTASGAVGQVLGQVIGDVSDKSIDENKQKFEDLTREEKTKVFSGGEAMAEAPWKKFMQYHGVEFNSNFGQDLRESMIIGYGQGNDRENQQGADPVTG
ncbi:hypothetical protein QFZ82_002647 [Streptomyces sp. V4I23]|uniref:hypothetical protein n=1 Tax=Streptomyces sp. V4I23 TaxID=3042282 RepID=UPI002788419B|nr:hypothetical protein [Streptomyces sp. V4I23]MDQ1008162.1 hypothetical protein [Streptomyces sp. V4I23]